MLAELDDGIDARVDRGAQLFDHLLHLSLDVVRVLAGQQADVEGDRAAIRHLVVLGASADGADVQDRSAGQQRMRFVRQGRFQLAQSGQDRLHRLDGVDPEMLVGGVRLPATGRDLQVGGSTMGDADRVARRLAIDGRVTDESGRAQRPGADPTLEVAGHALEHDVATRPVATRRDPTQRRSCRRRAGLHVGDAGSVDLAVFERRGEGIPRPVLAQLIDVEMTVEHQRPSAAGARQTGTDRRPTRPRLDQLDLVASPCRQAVGEELGELAFPPPDRIDRADVDQQRGVVVHLTLQRGTDRSGRRARCRAISLPPAPGPRSSTAASSVVVVSSTGCVTVFMFVGLVLSGRARHRSVGRGRRGTARSSTAERR